VHSRKPTLRGASWYSSGNIAALAALLKDALSDRARLESIRQAAIERMKSWSPTQNVSATVDAIRIAVERIGRRPAATLADPGALHAAPPVTSKLQK
jgi:hypothetical protein